MEDVLFVGQQKRERGDVDGDHHIGWLLCVLGAEKIDPALKVHWIVVVNQVEVFDFELDRAVIVLSNRFHNSSLPVGV